jgi:hypothetical protein
MLGSSIRLLDPANETPMSKRVSAALLLDAYGLHQPAACSGPIAWVNVDMLAVQALRTVVCITVATHSCAAIAAAEIFDGPLERFVGQLFSHSGLYPRWMLGACRRAIGACRTGRAYL